PGRSPAPVAWIVQPLGVRSILEGGQRAGSRAPIASSDARPSPSAAQTPSAVDTFATAATPPAMSGPMLKPSATELALIPKMVLCASGGVSRPIMLAVAGMIVPLRRPVI